MATGIIYRNPSESVNNDPLRVYHLTRPGKCSCYCRTHRKNPETDPQHQHPEMTNTHHILNISAIAKAPAVRVE